MDWTTVYTACFILGLTVVGLSFLVGHFGGGHDAGGHDLDTGHDGAGHDGGDHESSHAHGLGGLPLFSPAVLSVFVGMFGVGGLLLHRALHIQPPLIHFFGAAGISLTSGLGIAWTMRQIFRVAERNTVASFRDVIGQEVEVLTAIRGKAMGEIAYTSGGSRQTLIAHSSDGTDFAVGARVQVLDIREGIAYVGPQRRRLSKEG
jgi:hypothetical protein